jgi:hypothetical protein
MSNEQRYANPMAIVGAILLAIIIAGILFG